MFFHSIIRWFRTGPNMVQIPDKNYQIGETTVTQGQWKRVMGTEPWKQYTICTSGLFPRVTPPAIGDHYPAVGLNWYDAVEFCKKLGYRLPTSAELGNACAYITHSGIWEWCQDNKGDDYRILMSDSRRHVEMAYSVCAHDMYNYKRVWFGFRLARTLQ